MSWILARWVVLGHRYDEPGRVAFLVAHEAGHIASGDCSPDTLVLDEDEAVLDPSDMEKDADCFRCTRVARRKGRCHLGRVRSGRQSNSAAGL